jgi:DNA-directed RNA polymerase subunit M/transcription elongation factor TFIIS
MIPYRNHIRCDTNIRYDTIKMNAERKSEIAAITACINNYDSFVSVSEKRKRDLASRIENSIYENARIKAIERHVRVDWNNVVFIEIYSNISYNIKVNLDVNSRANSEHEGDARCYLASRLYNYLLSEQMKEQYGGQLSPISVDKIASHFDSIAPESLGSLSSVELNPLINQVYLDEIKLRQQQGISMKYSKMYKCGRCGKSKTRLREIQSASADEGTTLFIHCIACNHRWRQYS